MRAPAARDLGRRDCLPANVARSGRRVGVVLGTLVPTLGLVQVGGHRMADRFTYVPSIGFFILIVWGGAAAVARWPVARKTAAVAMLAASAALAVAARAQVWVWQDSVSLWQHTVQASPSNARAFANLGASWAERGRVAEAIASYRASLELEGASPKVWRNLGLALLKVGARDEATDAFRNALRLDPIPPRRTRAWRTRWRR